MREFEPYDNLKLGLAMGIITVLFIVGAAAWNTLSNIKREVCATPPDPTVCCQAMTPSCVQ